MNYLLVFIGGGFGSVMRFVIARNFPYQITTYPWLSTFSVNALGSFFLGIMAAYALKNDSSQSGVVVFLTVGFCGGFTTFSTFSLELFQLLKTGMLVQAFVYFLASIAISVGLLFLGYRLI